MLTLIANGWRVAPELVPAILQRHRSDPVRRARAEVACGPLACMARRPRSGTRRSVGPSTVEPESLGELPELPIAPALVPLLAARVRIGRRARRSDRHRRTRCAHRAVVVNLLARVRPDALASIASALGSIGRPRRGRTRLGARRPRHHPPPHARRTLPLTTPSDERTARLSIQNLIASDGVRRSAPRRSGEIGGDLQPGVPAVVGPPERAGRRAHHQVLAGRVDVERMTVDEVVGVALRAAHRSARRTLSRRHGCARPAGRRPARVPRR